MGDCGKGSRSFPSLHVSSALDVVYDNAVEPRADKWPGGLDPALRSVVKSNRFLSPATEKRWTFLFNSNCYQ